MNPTVVLAERAAAGSYLGVDVDHSAWTTVPYAPTTQPHLPATAMPVAPASSGVPDIDTNTAFMPGFRSLDRELDDYRLPVEGSVPEWLGGRLVRNGPGKFEVGGDRVSHWFDGLGMLRSYAFADGEIR